MNNRQLYSVHLHGALAANASGVVPMPAHVGATLLEVAASASNANSATLALGVGGTSPDTDAIMTEQLIGQSGAPEFFLVGDFDGVLADPLHTDCPRFGPQALLTWNLNYNGTGTNETQTVTLTRNPTGGTFTLTYAGQTTAGIAWNASAAVVQAALRLLSNITPDKVTVTGNAGGPWTVAFGGTLAETNVAEMTGSASALTGGVDEVQLVTIGGTPTAGTFTITYAGQTTGGIAYNATAAAVQTALRLLSNITPDKVTVTGNAGGPYTVTFAGLLAGQNVAEMTASAAALTGGLNEIQLVTLVGTPTAGTFTVTYAGQTTSALAYNVSAADLQAALRLLSSINGAYVTVTGSAGGPYTLEFTGLLGGQNIAPVTASAALLTGGTNEVQVITVTGTPNAGNFSLTYAGQTTGNLLWNATGATVQTAVRLLSNITTDKATVTGNAGGPYTVTFVKALAGVDVAQMTGADVDLAGGGPYAVTVETTIPGVPPAPALTITIGTSQGGAVPDPALTIAVATDIAGCIPTLTIATLLAGVTLTPAANVDLVFTMLLGSVHSHVTGITP